MWPKFLFLLKLKKKGGGFLFENYFCTEKTLKEGDSMGTTQFMAIHIRLYQSKYKNNQYS